MKKLEENRDGDGKSLDYDGNDADGKCGAAIKALVMICGNQDDPFYYDEPGTCLDFAQVYKENFDTDESPPVVYFNAKNFTHPFSSTHVILKFPVVWRRPSLSLILILTRKE